MKNRLISVLCLLLFLSMPVMAAGKPNYLDEGNKLWLENKFDLAEQAFKKSIEANPDAAIGYIRLAGLYQSTQKNQLAIKTYQSAIEKDPLNEKLFIAIAIAYLHVGKHSMAKTMVERALELKPKDKNGQKLREYVTKRIEVTKRASAVSIAPKDSNHEKVNGKPSPRALTQKEMDEGLKSMHQPSDHKE